MLASMLAKTPTSLPEGKIQIPPSMISSTPDVKLPPNLEKKLIQIQHPQTSQQQQLHMVTPHQSNVLNIQSSSQSTMANQTMASQVTQTNLHLQLQQQPQHHRVQTPVTISMPTHMAIKSAAHHNNSIQLRPNMQQSSPQVNKTEQ